MSAKMRILAFLAIVFVLVGVARDGTDHAIQAQGGPPFASVVLFPTGFGVSPEVRDLPPTIVKPEDIDPEQPTKERPRRALRSEHPDADASVDPVVQSFFPDPEVEPLHSSATSFDGLSNADNFNSFGFRVSPPDTVGDVGPNHYVQQVNLLVRVWDKSGKPLTPPFKLSSLWKNLGGQCAAADVGDPIVVYDPLADRWILSQFAFANMFAPPYYECVAVSKTPDPTGDYFLYAFNTPGANFPDYPKLGVWPDAYYMTTNQFLNGAAFNGSGVYAFDRHRMLAGDPGATVVYFNLNLTAFPEAIGGMLPSDMDGMTPPPAGAPNVFSYLLAKEFGDAIDGLRLFDFHVDFANPSSSTFVERMESPLAVAGFNPLSPPLRDDIEQPPPAILTGSQAAALDSISDRLMYRLAYRNFGTHESLVVNHTVNVGTGTTISTHQAAVRYYELRRSGGSFGVAEQATFAPDTDNRWMGSAAMDHQGNLAVGYSVSSLTTRPSIRYAGRLVDDPPGGLFQGEQTLVNGTGVQRDPNSRWGDYSAMSVDPVDDCTFWYTNQYYTAASQASSPVGWLTRIGRFSFPTCTPAPLGALVGAVTDKLTGLPISGAFVTTTNGFVRVSDAAGAYSMTLPPGAHTLTASAFGYKSATVNVDVTDGAVIQNLALIPVPIVVPAGATLRKESCSLNGNLDPGERVTATLTLQNIGHGATRNLVATLQPTGGVMSPSRPQSYGAIPTGGTGAEEFSFTANAPCGGTVVATLRLTDRAARQDNDGDHGERDRGTRDDEDDSDADYGSQADDIDLGTASFTFRVGTPSPIATPQTFSSGNLSTPIPDLTTIEIPLTVPALGPVEDVNVRVRLSHTFLADLTIDLVGPDGTTVRLAAGNGGGGNNLGTGSTDCSGPPTVFDDAATASIATGTAPFAGSFRPVGPLAAFNGHDGQGTWRLRITDTFGLDPGTLHCVQLEISQHRLLCCTPGGTPTLTADTAMLRRESFVPPSHAIDPGERVTVDFGLRNIGSGNTRNLVATLLPTGGVSSPGPPRRYGELHVAGAPVARSFRFTPAGQCGATITPTLQLRDGRLTLGTVSYSMRLGATERTTWPFDHLTPVAINDSSRTSGVALATPYPSEIHVAGLEGTIGKVTATLHGFAHTFPSDVDVLLVGPAGQMVVLLSDAGGGTSIQTTVTFDDAAPGLVPAAIVSGSYRPTNIGTRDIFPAPAPALIDPFETLSVFNGTSPNGVWRLFVVDDSGPDHGTLAGGWSLAITVEKTVCAPPPPPRGDRHHDDDDRDDD